MNIIVGASGQIGSNIVKTLKKHGEPVIGIVRSAEKAKACNDSESRIADLLDVEALKAAFSGGHTVFLLTPENPQSKDIIAETSTILHHYKEAIQYADIKRVVGLSSIGAQHKTGTGNLEMSYMLEHAFEELPVEQVFIRPAYYYSNWLSYLETVREHGILPTFFPVDQKIPMVAPTDVAKFCADIIMKKSHTENIWEVVGPIPYSSSEVAEIFSRVLSQKVETQQIPRKNWASALQQAGFSENATENLMKMTEAVITGKASPEKEETQLMQLETNLPQYLQNIL